MVDNRKIWKKVLDEIKNREDVNPISFKTWLLPASIRSIDKDLKIAYIEAEDSFVINILKSRFIPLIESSLEAVMNEPYRVVVKQTGEESAISDSKLSQKNTSVNVNLRIHKEQRIFNPKYTFENFVVGEGNKYAHAAALAVAESPSETYNPLFIYGGSGLGKTHLMHAIGTRLLRNNENINVLYVSSEMFLNELIKAIKEKTQREFRNKYRLVDVLLVDDIQFLESVNTTSTQVEFFNTFNTLYDLNKQIVISSDRPPNKLDKLEERLRSRFAWNMIVDLTPADYETRVAILLKKAENFNLNIDDDIYEVICMIADKVTDNIRMLEGAFTRIVGYSSISHEKINKKLAMLALKDVLQSGGGSPTTDKIKASVSRYYNIKVSELESSKRTNNIAYPRQVAMYLCRNMMDISNSKIGSAFGNRHYTTVMHACDKIQKEIKSDPKLKEVISDLKEDILT